MSFGGFDKNSGPGTGLGAPPSFGNLPAPAPPRPVSSGNEQLNGGVLKAPAFNENDPLAYQRSPNLLPQLNSSSGTHTEVQNTRRNSSPYSRSADEVSKKPTIVIVKTQSPPAYQKDQYVGGQLPHAGGVMPRPFSSTAYPSQLRPSSYSITPPTRGFSPIVTTGGAYESGSIFQAKKMDVPFSRHTRSSTPPPALRDSTESTIFHPPAHQRSLIDYRDLDAPEEVPSPSVATESRFSVRDASGHFSSSEKPFAPSPMWDGQKKTFGNNSAALAQADNPSFITARGTHQSGKILQPKTSNSPLSKRTRSPTIPPTDDSFPENTAIESHANKRTSDFQSQSRPSMSGQTSRAEVAFDQSMQFPAVKRTKTPLPSSSNQGFQENLDPAEDSERELQAKAKRLARFKDELSQPVLSNSTVRNQSIPYKNQHQSSYEKQQISEGPTFDMTGDSSGGSFIADNEAMASSGVIVGLCPDMCPESERAERERKGDLDQYERVDGDRNLTSEFLAVKKYTRTAEREARLIRSMPILQKTMDYLLDLLSEPYSDRFLGLYNFLWDRMRAIRMDLRMQHIFNLEAINMLEQMIRLHIIAMHELCEYTKGEGFSEGFDAHLNIEQMNKTSVELFQLYDDHRKKGIHVPSEREFRGYYALLKLDKHPGYKVEPAELSLDLAKMTPEIRQTPEVLFARDVARACRTGNFISFFRLSNKASYLQACLMHAHFSKLRTNALASLHSGLQINQGIPVTHVAKWIGMEEEGMDELLEYHGFSVKDFNEPYMMKENAFINADTDFPIKRSKLVDRKRSETIASDVSFSSQTESYTAKEVPRLQLKKSPEPAISGNLPSLAPVDTEMLDLRTIPSPKVIIQSPKIKTPFNNETADEKLAPASTFAFNFTRGSDNENEQRVDSPLKRMFDPVFRKSFGDSSKQDTETVPSPVNLETNTAEEIRFPVSPRGSVIQTPIICPSLITPNLEDDQIPDTDEDGSDEMTSNCYDQEVAEAKLRLILRIWKRHTSKKKQLREHKQLAASAAMNLLSMGPPMWQYQAPLSNYSMLDIDHVMNERYEMQEQSSSVLNPSDVVAPKLAEKNPDSKCLCWKMVVSFPQEDDIGLQKEATQLWFHSKLMPVSSNDDLIVASSGLAIWRSWIPSLSGINSTCCLSVIKCMSLNNLNETIVGANAIVFILSDYFPLELQKKRLHGLIFSLPESSCLPLLILCGASKGELNASSIDKNLELHYIDKSKVAAYKITFLENVGNKDSVGFFSNEYLREGLEWLASKTPPQIIVNEIKTRELVASHLNPSLEILDGTNTHWISPNSCISAFNESLDRSMMKVTAAVNANPIGWPCPEIDMIEHTSHEYQAITCYLPNIGWSSVSKTEVLRRALSDSALPPFEDDLSWLSRGVAINEDIESQVLTLENCLVNYLTRTSKMMGLAMAQKEARITMQKFSGLELHGSTYYIIPRWVSIFRRIFNWRLMSLTKPEVVSTYVLQQDSSCEPISSDVNNSDVEAVKYTPPYIVNPSLHEMIEVGHHLGGLQTNRTDHGAFPVWSADAPTPSYDVIIPMEKINIPVNNEENNVGTIHMARSKEADKLTELLEKCNIMQNKIDKKLSLYF